MPYELLQIKILKIELNIDDEYTGIGQSISITDVESTISKGTNKVWIH